MASKISQIVGYEGLYSVTSDGRVFSHKRNKFLSNTKRNLKGAGWYQMYVLTNASGIKKSVSGHRLVADAFIPNKDNLKCVNHIDGDKTNNDISNLEWCTHKQNMQHAADTGLLIKVPLEVSKANGKNVGQYKKDNAKISDEEWSEIGEATGYGVISGAQIAKHYGVTRSYINGRMKEFGIKKGECK